MKTTIKKLIGTALFFIGLFLLLGEADRFEVLIATKAIAFPALIAGYQLLIDKEVKDECDRGKIRAD